MRNLFATLTALAFFTTPASAHVTANPNKGEAGTYFQTSFRVSHGCDGSPTKSVKITLPAGFITVKPQYKAGWKLDIVKRKLDKPVRAAHGKTATEEFAQIVWSGGNLPDEQYDEFGLLVKLPDTVGKLWFPVIQECESGELRWNEVPSGTQQWHDMQSPAPFVEVGKPASSHSHH